MTLPQPRKLGTTDIEVSTVAMGCWAITGDQTWGPQDEKDAIKTLLEALECGITFFDTAELYGNGYSETLLGRALAAKRDQIVIGSKISSRHVQSRCDLEQSCEDSLRRLKTDFIDVYHLHWPARDVPMPELLDQFQRLRDSGKIRTFAVSNFGCQDLTELLQHGRCEVNQLPYSLLWRVIEKEIQPLCLQHKISITCYSPLAQALLTGKFQCPDEVPAGRARTRHFASTRPQARHGEEGQEVATFAAIQAVKQIAAEIGRPLAEVAIAWLLRQPGIASVIAGARTPGQIRMNAAAMQLQLSDDVLLRLSSVTDALKQKFGMNPDMWQSQSRYR